jgi:hypothetical protein
MGSTTPFALSSSGAEMVVAVAISTGTVATRVVVAPSPFEQAPMTMIVVTARKAARDLHLKLMNVICVK